MCDGEGREARRPPQIRVARDLLLPAVVKGDEAMVISVFFSRFFYFSFIYLPFNPRNPNGVVK